jgi:hypothetical protein
MAYIEPPTQLQNAVLHRKSFVTNTGLHASEPYIAAPIILSHESLWIDSEMIPLSVPTLRSANPGNAEFLDPAGEVTLTQIQDGNILAVVEKKVHVVLSRGIYAEYNSNTEDLRRLIHQNYSNGYLPLVEYADQGTMMVLPAHLWTVHQMSGLLLVNAEVTHTNLYLTAYFYCGRVGLSKRIKDPTTDDIVEGVANKFFTKDLLMTHINDLSMEGSTNFVLSVSNSDSVIEGVYNKFFTHENFDDAFHTKTLDDLQPSDKGRLVNAASMRDLNLRVGGVTELGFSSRSQPDNTSGKLYVEQEAGRNVLFFEDTRVGGVVESPKLTLAAHTEGGMGNFTGSFQGETRGVHTGDVIGNVTGFVSDLGNHPIIEAKILGSGEGHWVGTVNADVVGKFEGHAKIVTGSIDNAYHITIGTYDSTASLHVKANDKHMQLSHTNGSTALIECLSNGILDISCSAIRVPSVSCDTLASQAIRTHELTADAINCAGIQNSFYGIFEAGRIEDVSELIADTATLTHSNATWSRTSDLSCGNALISVAYANLGVLSTISVNSCYANELTTTTLSVSNFHVENLSFDASLFLENPNLVFNSLSVSSAVLSKTSVGRVDCDNLTVRTAAEVPYLYTEFSKSTTITANYLSVSTLHLAADSVLEIGFLSVNTLHATDSLYALCSVNTCFVNEVIATNTSTQSLHTDSVYSSLLDSLTISTSLLQCETVECGVVGVISMSALTLNAGAFVASNSNLSSCVISFMSCADAQIDTLHIENATVQTLSTGGVNTGVLSAHTLSVLSAGAFSQTVSYLSASIIVASVVEALSISSHRIDSEQLHSVSLASTYLSVNYAETENLFARSLSVQFTSMEHATIDVLSVASSLSNVLRVQNTISCAQMLVVPIAHMSTASITLLDSESIVAAQASVHTLNAYASFVSLLSVSNAEFTRASVSVISCSALNCDDVTAPRGSFSILSVNQIVGVDLGAELTEQYIDSLFLSLSDSIDETIGTLSLSSVQNMDDLLTLSCSSGKIDLLRTDEVRSTVIQSDSIYVSELVVTSLSVSTLHGIVLTQNLSVTGLVDHISTSSVTTSDLSCGTLFVNNIQRTIPHISSTANPAVLTSSNVGDFALFAEDAKHSGDMIIEGSLYVTDTIFMGTEPALVIENVQHMVASSISVGELAVGMLTGIGGSTIGGSIYDMISNLLSVSPHDTVHEGNMQIEGNLVVSGVVLTGAHNKLMNNNGFFEMDGTLSVSGDVLANGTNLSQTITDLKQRVDELENLVSLLA